MEASYASELLAYCRALAQAIRDRVIPALPAMARDAYHHLPDAARPTTDAWTDDFQRRIGEVKVEVAKKYSDDELRRIATRTGQSVADFNRRAVKEQFKRVVGLDVLLTEPYLRTALAGYQMRNFELIKTIEQRQIARLNNVVAQGFAAGERWENIAGEIEDTFDVSESDAARIARDQVNKLNGELTRLRQTELGIEKYVWSTSQDDRVRDSHAEKEGKTFRWDDPPADTGHPGEDINCRCVALPVLPGEEE